MNILKLWIQSFINYEDMYYFISECANGHMWIIPVLDDEFIFLW